MLYFYGLKTFFNTIKKVHYFLTKAVVTVNIVHLLVSINAMTASSKGFGDKKRNKQLIGKKTRIGDFSVGF